MCEFCIVHIGELYMSSGDEPLLKPSELSYTGCQHRSTATQLSCLRSKVSISSSTSDAETRLLDVKDDEEITAVDDPSVDIAVEWSKKPDSRHRRFLSVASRVSEESLLLPTRDRKRLSWVGMELKGHPTAFEISGTLPKAQEELRKSQVHDYNNEQLDDDIFRNQSPRLIYFNDPDRTTDKCKFSSNEIQTSKYTLLNFLPKNLFFQFQRVAYLYFLVIAALNQLPPLAVFGRTASLFPLLFVLSVTAIKDGYEDWRRHTSDKKENNREALVLQSGMFQMKKWKDIRVGEIVKICADETIPCDMVLLETSAPSGAAYIQTMNLDGESNLKTRYARQEVANVVSEGAMDSGLIRCEQPNRNVYEFTANMEFRERNFPLSQANIILRGCQLKNTEWVIGVVVYAGQETKAMLNSGASPSKRSKLERCMNRETLWLSFLLFIMCSVVALGMGLWLERHKEQLDTLPYYRKRYFTSGRDDGKIYKFYGIPLGTLIAFLSSIIVFQIMIPISLYITMELVRLGQSYFMIGDKHMYDSSSDSKFQCRALNINEDLGQIRYIFSDKTGTLTRNKMEFRTVSIFGKKYGALSSTAEASSCQSHAGVTEAAFLSRRKWKLKSEINVDLDLVELLHKDSEGDDRVAAHEFFLTLAACNTVIPIFNQSALVGCIGVDVEDVDIDYQGESPDEQALVAAASAYGYTLFERTSGHIVLDVNGERLRLDVLGLHEFDSTRKRMSVVVRFPDNTVKLLLKGADTSVFSLLAEGTGGNGYVQTSTQDHLTEYSSLGLRTLVLAARDLTNTELEEWLQKYEDASTSLTDRSAKLRQTAALIEHDLRLLGATGVDDKLQDGVPEAVESLRQAGIKVWVLTGDKRETAISIGLSCKLLTIDMQQIIINGASKEECKTLLAEAKSKYLGSACCGDQNLKWKKDTMSSYLKIPDEPRSKNTMPWNPEEEALTSSSLALIIDGSSLVHILEQDLELEACIYFIFVGSIVLVHFY
ncbi:hypothetical protein Cgig2_025507 [Carnegiea gigantea]|uniref:Phospholipid-transporting ATPase n=1 Tax=Carnegiea gigantea TaxID=171969 RepID=A0A9Q1JKR6_9CARY|nr:hypothetical protein Cgig2_025507 [Carnegiea gigantea]